jgi:hypothetical protein
MTSYHRRMTTDVESKLPIVVGTRPQSYLTVALERPCETTLLQVHELDTKSVEPETYSAVVIVFGIMPNTVLLLLNCY